MRKTIIKGLLSKPSKKVFGKKFNIEKSPNVPIKFSRVNFQYAANAYPEKYIGLKNVKRDRNGRATGVIECVGTKMEVAERLRDVDGNVAIVIGNKLKQTNRIGGQIFYE